MTRFMASFFNSPGTWDPHTWDVRTWTYRGRHRKP